MHLDLHLTDGTELLASSRVDDTGRPFAEIQWDFHGPLPEPAGNGTLWGTTAAMRRLAEEEAAWHAHTTRAAAAGSRVA